MLVTNDGNKKRNIFCAVSMEVALSAQFIQRLATRIPFILTAFLALLTFLCSNYATAQAQQLQIILQLTSIIAEKVTEARGDELYLEINQYYDEITNQHLRVPMYPMYWKSSQLKDVYNVQLLQTKLLLNQQQDIFISLAEYDCSGFCLDDHLGTVKLTIANYNGQLQTHWSVPVLHDQPDVQQLGDNAAKFSLHGDGGKYLLNFAVNVAEDPA